MPSGPVTSAATDLAAWLDRVGDVTREPGSSHDEARLRVRDVDPAALRQERVVLLSAYLHRRADERQIRCAMTRVEVEERRKAIGIVRAWVRRVDDRLDGSLS